MLLYNVPQVIPPFHQSHFSLAFCFRALWSTYFSEEWNTLYNYSSLDCLQYAYCLLFSALENKYLPPRNTHVFQHCLTLKKEALRSFETSVRVYPSTWHNIQEDLSGHLHLLNPKCREAVSFLKRNNSQHFQNALSYNS